MLPIGACSKTNARNGKTIHPMNSAFAAMPPRYGLHDFERYRLRLAIASLISLLIHALLLSLEFGFPGLGLPGLQAPWSERRAQDESLHIQLADVNRSTSAITEPASEPVTARQNNLPASNAGQAPGAASSDTFADHHAAPQHPPKPAAISSLSILPAPEPAPAANPKRFDALNPPSPANAASRPSKSSKPASGASKKKRQATALAEKRSTRRAKAAPDSKVIARATADIDSFSVPLPAEIMPQEHAGPEQSATQETMDEHQQAELAEEPVKEKEQLAAASAEQSEPELAEAEKPSPAAVPLKEEIPDPQQAAVEAQIRAEALQQQEEERARLAEQLAAQKQAEENEKLQAMERQRQKLAEQEAQRLAEQEEQRAREIRQMAAREAEEAARSAELDAQRQADLLAREQAQQLLAEEARREQQLAAQMKADEEARRHAAAAEEQRRAEMAAQEQAVQQRLAAAEQRARELAAQEAQMQELARQAQQAALERQQQEGVRAQALVAQSRAQDGNMKRQGADDPDQTSQGSSRGEDAAGVSSGSGGEESGKQSGSGASDTRPAASSTAAAPDPTATKSNELPDQGDDGPIMLTDAQLDSVKVAQIRKIDTTRLESWEVRELEPNTQTARRRTLFGRAQDDIVLKMYIDEWERQVEKNSESNDATLPGKPANHPLVTVSIRSDGSVENIAINRSSGQPEIDQAISEIVSRSAYRAFPRDLARRYDVIEIRRVWDFSERLRLREAAP